MAALTTATAPELSKLVGAAVEAARLAGDDAAELGRALDALKQLAKLNVTAALLKETDAGKRVNKLCKHGDAKVCAAATAAVAAEALGPDNVLGVLMPSPWSSPRALRPPRRDPRGPARSRACG